MMIFSGPSGLGGMTPTAVGVGHAFEDAFEQFERVANVVLCLEVDPLAEGLAVDEFHDEERTGRRSRCHRRGQ